MTSKSSSLKVLDEENTLQLQPLVICFLRQPALPVVLSRQSLKGWKDSLVNNVKPGLEAPCYSREWYTVAIQTQVIGQKNTLRWGNVCENWVLAKQFMKSFIVPSLFPISCLSPVSAKNKWLQSTFPEWRMPKYFSVLVVNFNFTLD